MRIRNIIVDETLLTVLHTGTSTTIQSKGECRNQKRPMKLHREDQCVVRCEEAEELRCVESTWTGSDKTCIFFSRQDSIGFDQCIELDTCKS